MDENQTAVPETANTCGSNTCGGNAMANQGMSSAMYTLGVLGAGTYYVIAATSIIGGAFGIFKALFWPGFFVYELLKLAGA